MILVCYLLETNESVVVSRISKALTKYGHQVSLYTIDIILK